MRIKAVNCEKPQKIRATMKRNPLKRYCIVPDCNRGTKVSVFLVPQNIDMRSKWVKAIRDVYPELHVYNNFVVCEKHFRKTDLTQNLTDASGNIIIERPSQRKRLKYHAVPHFDMPNLDSGIDSLKMVLMERDNPDKSEKIVQESTSQPLDNTMEPTPIVKFELEREPLVTVKSEPPELAEIKKETVDNNDFFMESASVVIKKVVDDASKNDMELEPLVKVKSEPPELADIKKEIDDNDDFDMESASVVVKKEFHDDEISKNDMDIDETSSKIVKQEPNISNESTEVTFEPGVSREYKPRGRKPSAQTWIPIAPKPLIPATVNKTLKILGSPQLVRIAPKGKVPVTSSMSKKIPAKPGNQTKLLVTAKSVGRTPQKIPIPPIKIMPTKSVGKTKIIPVNSKNIPIGAVPLIPLTAGDSKLMLPAKPDTPQKIPIPPFKLMPTSSAGKTKTVPVNSKNIPVGAVPLIPLTAGDSKLMLPAKPDMPQKTPIPPFKHMPANSVGKTKIISVNSKNIPIGAVPLIPLTAGDSKLMLPAKPDTPQKIPIPPFKLMPANSVGKTKIIPVNSKNIPIGAVPLIPFTAGDSKLMLPSSSVVTSQIKVVNGKQLQVLNPGPSTLVPGTKTVLLLCPDGTMRALNPAKPPPHIKSMVKILPKKQTEENSLNSLEADSDEESNSDNEGQPRKKERVLPWYITIVSREEIIKNREKNLKDPKYLNAPLKCEYCASYFYAHDRKILHKRHRERCHGQSKENAEFACFICGLSFETLRLYNIHFRYHSYGCHTYQCPTCQFTTARYRTVQIHDCPNTGGKKVPPKEPTMKLTSSRRQYYCPKCRFMSAHALGVVKLHYQRFHKDNREVKCEVCGKICLNQLTYKSHMKIKHVKKAVAFCEPCNKPFYIMRRYRDHMKSSIHQLPFACNECPKKFHLAIRLKNHKKVHERVRARKNKSKLLSHTSDVTGRRLFKCNFCDLTFKHRCSVYNHIKLKHKGKKVDGRLKNGGKKKGKPMNNTKEKSHEHSEDTEESEHSEETEKHEHCEETEEHEHSKETEEHEHSMETEEHEHTRKTEEHEHIKTEEHEYRRKTEKHEHSIKTEEHEHSIKREEYEHRRNTAEHEQIKTEESEHSIKTEEHGQ